MHQRCSKRAKSVAGFTLIELMVAIVIMALLALLSWRGLDGMSRVQTQTQDKTDGVLALQAGLAQWQTDLDAVTQFPQSTNAGALGQLSQGMHYDGQVLRLVRRYTESSTEVSTENSAEYQAASTANNQTPTLRDSIRVVAWSQRAVDGKTQWLRWQSPALSTRAELQSAWLQAAQWAQNPGDAEKTREVVVAAIDKWQIFYYRNDAWTNALSSADEATNPGTAVGSVNGGVGAVAQSQLPDGVRLVLTLSEGQALVGNITRDWVRPTLGGGK